MDEITLELDPAYVGSAYSPQVEVSEVERGHSVAITHDSPEGLVTQTFDVMDGEDGVDGVSPTAKVERNATGALVTVTDGSGTTTAQLTDGTSPLSIEMPETTLFVPCDADGMVTRDFYKRLKVHVALGLSEVPCEVTTAGVPSPMWCTVSSVSYGVELVYQQVRNTQVSAGTSSITVEATLPDGSTRRKSFLVDIVPVYDGAKGEDGFNLYIANGSAVHLHLDSDGVLKSGQRNLLLRAYRGDTALTITNATFSGYTFIHGMYAAQTGTLVLGWSAGPTGISDATAAVTVTVDDGGTTRTETLPLWMIAVRDGEDAPGAAVASRVTSLDSTALTVGTAIDATGIPAYVADPTAAEYAPYGITEPGWYVLARITAPDGITVGASTTVDGAAGSIVRTGADHIDVAVLFDAAAQSVPVTVSWGGTAGSETYLFRAQDLAVRNLDYRTTFYVYDISPYVTWEYGEATGFFLRNKAYFQLVDGEYVRIPERDCPVGDAVTEGTYCHTKVRFEGMVRNVTYALDEIIDCPVEVVLPDVPDDGYGAWYEIQTRYQATYSMTLLPEAEGVKAATDATQAQSAGVNIIDLHYADVAGAKIWRMINTHSNVTDGREAAALAFRNQPAKTSYAVGESLDTSGAELVLTWSDGSTQLLGNSETDPVGGTLTYSPANGTALTAEDTTLTASYKVGDVTVTATTSLTVQ